MRPAAIATVGSQNWRPMDAMESLGKARVCHRGEEIYGREDPAKHWYRLVSGMARKCALLADGRRQIVDFLLPGDFFGFVARHEHFFAVEAVIEGTVVVRYPRRSVELLADANPMVGQRIREVAFDAISRSQARMLILGSRSAAQKVASFLVEMAERLSDRAPDVVVLPMSRYDIADYLALSVETVSRALTDLKQRGVIALAGTHQVTIVDRVALEDWSGSQS